jgi:hypothetical protein
MRSWLPVRMAARPSSGNTDGQDVVDHLLSTCVRPDSHPARQIAMFTGPFMACVLIAMLWLTPNGAVVASSTQPAQENAPVLQNPRLDPERVAYFESAGWRAYYDRNWPRVFRLMVQLNQEEFRMSLPTALAASVDIVRASIAFAPIDNDVPAATAHLRRFYDKARRARGLQADAQTLAALEMDYWVVHRRLAQERKQASNHDGDIEPMVASLTRLHAALFAASPAAIRRSAELRAQAAVTVDRITGGYSTDVAADWRQVEAHLLEAYRVLQGGMPP